MPDFIQITTTSDKKEILQNIAGQRVEARLAACVQISGPIESNYEWQNRLEISEEWLCTIKTSKRCEDAAMEMISSRHNYDVPEIIVTPIISGGASYLAWLREQTAND